jgi:hypothetical protein
LIGIAFDHPPTRAARLEPKDPTVLFFDDLDVTGAADSRHVAAQ